MLKRELSNVGTKWLLSCEHGGNEIPSEFKMHFKDANEILESHKGWDPGALSLYRMLIPQFDAQQSAKISRLVVELNRSAHHPNLLSCYTKSCTAKEKATAINKYYTPYREAIEEQVYNWVNCSYQVIHISIHSFTPVFNGETRNADIGLLYDPKHAKERGIAVSWQKKLNIELPMCKIRLNYPYLGKADGLPTHLRRMFGPLYNGFEFEMNNKYAGNTNFYHAISKSITELRNHEMFCPEAI